MATEKTTKYCRKTFRWIEVTISLSREGTDSGTYIECPYSGDCCLENIDCQWAITSKFSNNNPLTDDAGKK